MELRFETMLYSNLGSENLMRIISNVHAGRRFPTLDLDNGFDEFAKTRRKVRQVY